ncbi:UNVERIFIED_CONTAM: hypothetical protein PYX00_001016 [Menopon gallinae]|uniref:Uncharacterized protein n=1 Tax=Menopon gallinae TaxID=328185 RepID=A0AAW2IBE3_9NEOP
MAGPLRCKEVTAAVLPPNWSIDGEGYVNGLLEMLLKWLSAMYAEKKPEESLGQICTSRRFPRKVPVSRVRELDEPCCNGTETATLISDEIEDTTTEVTTTEVPYTTENYETETYQPKDVLPVENETAAEEEPSESRIVFPDSLETSKRTASQEDAYQSWQGPYDVRKLPQQQFWWLPPNWRIDEEQRKPAVFKFWSHLPLVHDSSFIPDAHRRFLPPQHHDQFHQPPTRTPDGYSMSCSNLFPPRGGGGSTPVEDHTPTSSNRGPTT